MKTEKIKRLIALFIIFVLTAGLLTSSFSVSAKTDKISLSAQDESSNIAFSAVNMFPGDRVSRDFTVKVSHKNSISLFYRADIRAGYEKLAEVLKINVYLPDKDSVIYDGLMLDMPNSLECVLSAKEEEVIYRISVYLDTSVGNDYQNKQLVADFRWWYTEENNGGGNDDGGNDDDGNDSGDNNGGGGIGSGITPDTEMPANIKLVSEVILDGEYPRGSDFTFALKDKDGNVVQTVENQDGLIEFGTIEFTQTGKYIYYLEAVGGKEDNIDHDDTVYKVTVEVNKESNKYVAEVSYEKDTEPYMLLPRFVHTTKVTTDTDKPVETDTPTQPEETEKTTEPVLPKDDSEVTEDDETDIPSNPKTGDDTEIMLYVYLLGTSLILILLLLVLLLHRKEKKDEE